MKKLRPIQIKFIEQKWKQYTIRQKITFYMAAIFCWIVLSVLFNIWVAQFSLGDFNDILSESSKSSALVEAIENEANLFEQYIKNHTEENWKLLDEAIGVTQETLEELPFDCKIIGEERYSLTWSIKNCYEVYVEMLQKFFELPQGTIQYINLLYELYDIQDYLRGYSAELMGKTLETGSLAYRHRIPVMIFIPVIMAVFAVCLIFVMTNLSIIMNRMIVNPVLKLAEAAKRIAQNDFFIEDLPIEGDDEIGELTHAFNKMKFATGEHILGLEERRKTLALLHEEELKKLEAERRLETMKLEVLMNQVNPHFLFNTLNVIGGMAMLENAGTTEKMIIALSNLFRYNLKSSSAEAILSQELNVVRDYMYIQQMRFGERIDFEIECAVEENSTVIPTFTFQPLVENAIIHGLSPKEEGGKIYIRVWEENEETLITVEDTGVGMNEEKLEKLRNKLEEGNVSHESIGVGNVYRRFKIMYPEGQFIIHSKENQGTIITMRIPRAMHAESKN